MLAQFPLAPESPSQFADLFVQCLGLGLLIIGGAVMLSKRRFGAFFHLPEQSAHQIDPTDLLIGLLAFFWIPAAVNFFLTKAGVIPPTPASLPADWVPPTVQLWTGSLSRLLAIAVLIAVATRRFADGRCGWGLRGDRLPADAGAATVAYLSFWPICAGTVYVTRAIIEIVKPGTTLPLHPSIEILRGPHTSGMTAALTVLEAAVIAPIIEEMFFRGLLQPALARWWRSTWAAIIFCGLVFGAIHSTNVETVPALALFGIVLGFVYAKTRSLTAAIALHMLFNVKTLVWLWLDKTLGG